jgi:hypothetical protein
MSASKSNEKLVNQKLCATLFLSWMPFSVTSVFEFEEAEVICDVNSALKFRIVILTDMMFSKSDIFTI